MLQIFEVDKAMFTNKAFAAEKEEGAAYRPRLIFESRDTQVRATICR